jgi:hypothetical protein
MERLSGEGNHKIAKIPWRWPQPYGFTIFGRIYLDDSLWEDYLSKKPSGQTLSIIAHEAAHIKRLGTELALYVRYWTNREFRFDEEIAAITEEMKVLRKYGEVFDFEGRAGSLSGFAYLWCTDYGTAKGKLEKIWNGIGKEE